jgi:hypothetical protein
MDLRECPLVHSVELRKAYNDEVASSGKDYGYELELLRVCQRLASECDRKIAQHNRRIEDTLAPVNVVCAVLLHQSAAVSQATLTINPNLLSSNSYHFDIQQLVSFRHPTTRITSTPNNSYHFDIQQLVSSQPLPAIPNSCALSTSTCRIHNKSAHKSKSCKRRPRLLEKKATSMNRWR